MKRSRRILYPVSALMIGLVVGLAIGELGLQIGAYAMKADRRLPSRDDADITVLCVGDSHTFGLPLPEEESYPHQLQARLNERGKHGRVRVVNLGVPGANSAFVANRLERQLLQTRPSIVIVWVGVNNLWNVVETDAWDPGDSMLAIRRSLHRFRLFRLASIAWFSRVGHQYETSGRHGWYDGERSPSSRGRGRAMHPDPAPGLVRDLVFMGELARGLGVPIAFVSYPLASQAAINRSIEEAAGRLGAPLIVTAPVLRDALSAGAPQAELIDLRAGPHPSGRLYELVVEAMVPEIESTLATWRSAESSTVPGRVARKPGVR